MQNLAGISLFCNMTVMVSWTKIHSLIACMSFFLAQAFGLVLSLLFSLLWHTMPQSPPSVPPALRSMQVFGVTLAMALSMMPVNRDLSCVELWAGVASIAKAASVQGMESVAMDLHRVPGQTDVSGPRCENILLKDGFRHALSAVLRLRPKGLLWMAPVCGSFVFMNSSNCQRTKENPEGNAAYGPVQDGNRMAMIAAFFYALAVLMDVKPVIEQPSGSMMFRLPVVAKVVEEFKAQASTCARCAFTPGVRFGTRFLKRYKFMGQDWVKTLHTKCKCPCRKHGSMVRVGKRGEVTGNLKALKESQAYPPKLGEFVVKRFMKTLGQQRSTVPVQCSTVSPSSSWKRPPSGATNKPTEQMENQSNCPIYSWKRPSA